MPLDVSKVAYKHYLKTQTPAFQFKVAGVPAPRLCHLWKQLLTTVQRTKLSDYNNIPEITVSAEQHVQFNHTSDTALAREFRAALLRVYGERDMHRGVSVLIHLLDEATESEFE
jgi:hypothetical protein